jgi:hypothetical protein
LGGTVIIDASSSSTTTDDSESSSSELGYGKAKKSKKFTATDCLTYCTNPACMINSYFCVNNYNSGTNNKLCVVDNSNVCVQYYVDNGRLIARRNNAVYTITSPDIFINKIYFNNLTTDKTSVAIRLSATSTKNAKESVYYQTALTNTPLQ